MTLPVSHMRNVAVIAHVDHGKTTLVDSLLAASGTTLGQGEVRLMDSNTLERERGITILAKNTSIIYNRPDAPEEKFQVNIVDTPGHADFGGEVERIMTMVDGVCLIVDATEGPMAQTKFVLRKALAQGLRPIVVINKVDRPSARVGEVENEIFDLFVALDASDEQLEYPVLYASGRAGWATRSDAEHGTDMHPLFDAILSHIEPPKVDRSAPFKMLVTQIESDNYFGKCLIGRITAGSVRPGDAIKALDEEGKDLEATKVLKVLRRRGMNRFIVEEAHAGDIISLAGFDTATVNSTLCHPSVTEHIPSIPIDPPTLSMTFVVNDSPLNGQEGTTLTSNALRLRLQREAENNVSIRLHPGASKEQIEVHARGEMQLGVIIETMRREGSEMAVCPPQVVFDVDENGALLEPVEEVTLDVDEPMSGSCIEKLSKRGGEMKEFTAIGDGRVRLVFHIPTRGFLGYRSEFTNDTRGQGVINTVFLEYVKYKAEIDRNDKGALIAMEDGTATAYSLESAEARGTLFIEPGAKVYGGMVIGENSRNEDIELNVSKAKQLSNVRSVMKEDKVRLTPPRRMTLEEMISYCRDDEMIEITPKSLRLRKRYLNPIARKTAAKSPRVVATAGLRVAHKANLNFK
jgi:GTP-binding protein